jgi:predicted ATPase/DNA-binding SARP family transcriptional activator
MLRLLLFGTPRIERDGQIVPLRRTKALALLAYIAITGQPQDREMLLALLWPEFDAASARNNLRRELSLLKAALHEEILIADRLQIRWNAQADCWLDIAAFQAQFALPKQHGHPSGALCADCANALTTAVQLYTDDFLSGFSLPDSPAFDEWQFFAREQLRQQLITALQALISWQRERGVYGAALEHARRWLQLDGLHEAAQREVMRLYAWSGQHAAALRQYQECVRLLDAELGAEPEPETTALYEQIRSRTFARQADRRPETGDEETRDAGTISRHPVTPSPSHPLTRTPTHDLPLTAGFVGRQRELADIIRRLTDPECRLLTLVGPGGIGKTRLALQVAQTLAQGWSGEEALADGLLFVSLAAVETSSGLVSALAAAARFDFYPNVPPDQQLLDYFRAKRMLILLDNFEQLLGAVAFISELLAAAPGLRLLITSRVALNLREEWFHPLEGLSFPAEGDDSPTVAQLAGFDAVGLFEQHARRVRTDFVLSRERAPVVRLCQLVEGMPLAIELAASWLKVLSADQVVAALERGLEILSTRDHNIPQRHRSMRLVLEESWRLLSVEEQQALAGLSVFHGGFNAEAAEAVVGATLVVLAALVERSLLRAVGDGRFQLHELLRQFAAAHLAAGAHEEASTRARHSAYYMTYLAACGARLEGEQQPAALAEISAAFGNIRAAWNYAVAAAETQAIDQAIDALYEFFRLSCRYQEGEEVFGLAAAQLAAPSDRTEADEASRVQVRCAARQGAFAYFQGKYEYARARLEASLRQIRAIGLRREEVFALDILGQLAGWQGDYDEALTSLHRSLAICRSIDDVQQVAAVLQQIAPLLWDRGEFAEVRRLATESLAISRQSGRPDRIAGALDCLAATAVALGEYHAAETYYREALAVFEHIKHQLGIALEIGGLGLVCWARGGDAIHQSIPYFEQSLAMMRSIGHRRHTIDRLQDLARVFNDMGEYDRAVRYGHEGLAIARELGSAVYLANSLCCLAKTAIETADVQTARSLLRRAITIASERGLSMVLAEALLCCAELFVRESRPRPDRALDAARNAQALSLIEAVLRLPTWQLWKERALGLKADLEARLPASPTVAAADVASVVRWLGAAETPDEPPNDWI